MAQKLAKPAGPAKMLSLLLLDKEEGYGLTVTQVAAGLGVSRQAASALINGKCRVTPKMAARIAKFTKSKPYLWLRSQERLDEWEAAQVDCHDVRTVDEYLAALV